ncbi:MAG: hypothetical protein KDD31_05195 [Muricauda sp.]|nr:hypothetical protein [Allomuricauda sp.]
MKKMVYAVVLLLSIAQVNAQNFSPKQQLRLDRWGLNHTYLLEQNEANERLLRKILVKDGQRKNNLLLGAGFTGLGLLTFGVGNLIANGGSCGEDEFCENMGGAFLGIPIIVLGILEVGVWVPLFATSFLKKRKRNKMIRELQAQYPNPPEFMLFDSN